MYRFIYFIYLYHNHDKMQHKKVIKGKKSGLKMLENRLRGPKKSAGGRAPFT